MDHRAKPRVLIVTSSATRRGAELEANGMCSALRSRGMHVEIVALCAGSPPNLDLEVLGARPLSLNTLRRLRKRSRMVDLVIAWGSTTLPACSIALTRHTMWVYRSIGEPAAWVRGRFHRFATGLQFKRADRVVVLWNGAADQVASLYGVPREDVVVLPNCRDGARFQLVAVEQRRDAREALGLTPTDQVAIVLGALSVEKDPQLAIDAALAVPNCRILVVGDGPMRSELEARYTDQSAQGRVIFFGAMSDPRPYVAAADVLVISSKTEGMPGSVIEALLSGVAVAAVPVGAVPEMLRDVQSSRISRSRKPDDLTESIVAALGIGLESRIAARSQAASTFGIPNVSEGWASVINNALASRNALSSVAE